MKTKKRSFLKIVRRLWPAPRKLSTSRSIDVSTLSVINSADEIGRRKPRNQANKNAQYSEHYGVKAIAGGPSNHWNDYDNRYGFKPFTYDAQFPASRY
jgi:hypothetical protein